MQKSTPYLCAPAFPYPHQCPVYAQDEANAVGKNYYMKSVDQPAPTLAIARAVAAETYKLSREYDLSATYIFEHWNLTKSLRVPADLTAFRRSPRLSSLVNVCYPHDTPEQLALVRSVAERLTGLVTAAEGDGNVNNGYANYSAPLLILFVRRRGAVNNGFGGQTATRRLSSTRMSTAHWRWRRRAPSLVRI
jgi:hypothetical protein